MASPSFALLVRVTPSDAANASVEVSVCASDTVATLVSAIAKTLSVGRASVRLCFRGAEVRGLDVRGLERTLTDVGITAKHFVVALVVHHLSWCSASDGAVPASAVQVGSEANGTALYLARAPIDGGMHPGKVCAALQSCRVGYGGKEHCARQYSVLCCPTAVVTLETCDHDGSEAPARSLEAGWEADGTRLLAAVGVDPLGGRCPGKTRAGFDGCNVGFGGSEKTLQSYQVRHRVTAV